MKIRVISPGILILLFVCVLSISYLSCSRAITNSNNCTIIVKVYGAQGKMIYLYNVPGEGIRRKLLDSGTIKNAEDSLVFELPKSNEATYYVEEKETLNKFYFIADTAYIKLNCNNVTGIYVIQGSPANSSLKRYKDSLNALTKRIRYLTIKGKESDSALVNAQAVLKNNITIFRDFSKKYADTTSSPGVFLQVYNAIDFKDDYDEMKSFTAKAAARFPNSERIKNLKYNVFETASIFEEEFNVNDSLPSIQLPDANGAIFNTATLRGKYYLIDFWSTWCKSCYSFEQYKSVAAKKFDTAKFEIISVALDDNTEAWKNIVETHKLTWPQLIDSKMWNGPAVRTLKFDSIPFNFLVAPNGSIIAKAIPADSLLIVLNHFVKD